MKCPKCNSEVREDAKFCTKCGQKLEPVPTCPHCGGSLKPGAKFCTHCGQKLVIPEICSAASAQSLPKVESELVEEKNSLSQDITAVGGRIYWNIQPGQVARVIDEAEFATYNKIRGIIVAEGTTAYIRANGRTVASISGGTYDFTKDWKWQEECSDSFKNSWQVVANLFTSRKKKEEEPLSGEKLHEKEQQQILDCARKGLAFSVVVMLNKAFPLMIGAKQEGIDAYQNFQPMVVQTEHLEVKLGIHAYFRIVDEKKFMVHFLTDRKNLNSAQVVDELSGLMHRTLQDVLCHVELSDNRVPQDLFIALKDRINAVLMDSLLGVTMVRLIEISAENEDLKRFARLSREMYLSEKELDYLRRTNDFKNRLADEVNGQRIAEATNELELERRLREINKNREQENLLHEDELGKFRMLLNNERILREAQSDNEREGALAEILKTGLVREEELDVLRHQQEVNKEQRGYVLAMMQLKDSIEFERTRTEGRLDQALLVAKKDLEKTALFDQYQDERFNKEIEKQKAAANAQLDIHQRASDMAYQDAKRRVELEEERKQRAHQREMEEDDAQFKQFMAMQEGAERARQNERRHAAEMQQARLDNEAQREKERYTQAQTLSEDQLWALNGDSEAAKEFVKSKYNAEAERKANERMEAQRREAEERLDRERAENREDIRQNQDRMYDMMREVMQTMSGMQQRSAMEREQHQQERQADSNRLLQEREERLRRQESRMDKAYDRALDYTTQNNVNPKQAAQPVQQQPIAQPAQQKGGIHVCPDCGEPLEEGAVFCANCGCAL